VIKTIVTIDAEARPWEGPKGTLMFLSGAFTDGEGWSIGVIPANLDKRRAQLAQLVGVPGEFELEAKPEYQGVAQWKIKSYPGQTPFNPGGERKPSREKSPAETEAIARAVALKAAVEFVDVGWGVTGVLEAANQFLAWLQTSPAGGTASPASATPAGAQSGGSGGSPEKGGSEAHGEGVSDPSAPCIHPMPARKITATGSTRCGLCGELVAA
jgi:hypothetical protein